MEGVFLSTTSEINVIRCGVSYGLNIRYGLCRIYPSLLIRLLVQVLALLSGELGT